MSENPYKRDPYLKAAFVPKLKRSGVMIVSDFDGTQTTGADIPSEKELGDRKRVLDIAEKVEGVTVGVSARSHGLMMCQKVYEASVENGFQEPPPHWHYNPLTNKYEYVNLADVPFFTHNLNWDISAGFGSGILVMNGKGYFVDRIFDSMLKYQWAGGEIDTELMPWRIAAQAFLMMRCSHLRPYMADIESFTKYMAGEANVAPLNYRIQFNFTGSAGYAAMMELRSIIDTATSDNDPFAIRLQIIDESKLDPDPEKCRYVMYLVPWYGRKESMINRLLYQAARAAECKVGDIRMFYAGDTLTDLRAGLYAGGDAETTFLLATGSRLAPYLLERRQSYGCEDLSFLWANPKKGRNQPRLVATGEKGVYRFVHKIRGPRANRVVIGDERYPGETPPGSVAEFLEEFLTQRRAGH